MATPASRFLLDPDSDTNLVPDSGAPWVLVSTVGEGTKGVCSPRQLLWELIRMAVSQFQILNWYFFVFFHDIVKTVRKH